MCQQNLLTQIHDFTGECIKELVEQQANQNTGDGDQAAG